MKVFKSDFVEGIAELDSLHSDSGPYFEIRDFNNDGLLEVATFHRNYDGNPVEDPPIRTLYRMENGKFSKIDEGLS